jgi:hypothetical protein
MKVLFKKEFSCSSRVVPSDYLSGYIVSHYTEASQCGPSQWTSVDRSCYDFPHIFTSHTCLPISSYSSLSSLFYESFPCSSSYLSFTFVYCSMTHPLTHHLTHRLHLFTLSLVYKAGISAEPFWARTGDQIGSIYFINLRDRGPDQ